MVDLDMHYYRGNRGGDNITFSYNYLIGHNSIYRRIFNEYSISYRIIFNVTNI